MAKLDQRTLKALKDAGFPFNPTRLPNWHSAILTALTAGQRRSAPTDVLVDKAIKVHDILTRGKRRAFVVRQVAKSIKQLVGQGVLHEHQPGRVKLLLDDDSPKVQRLKAKKPSPWDEPQEPGEEAEGEVDADTASEAEEMLQDIDEEGAESAITTLPPLGMSSGVKAAPEHPTITPSETPDNEYDDEDERALDRLLPQADEPASSVHPHSGSLSESAIPASLGVLAERLSVLAPDLSVQASARSLTGRVGTSSISVDHRRDGSVRVMIAFSQSTLPSALRRNATTLYQAPIGIDANGKPCVFRIFASLTEAIAQSILADLQFVEDAAAAD